MTPASTGPALVRGEVPAALDGERVDRLVAFVTGRSRAEAADLVAGGQVDLGGEPVTVRSRRVVEGDRFEIRVPARAETAVGPDAAVDVAVVHEDEQVLVVDKPAGVVVHPGAGTTAPTLVAGLLARYPELAAVGDDPARPGIVHRLDKDTSGLLVVARTPTAFGSLKAQLADRSATRRYRALAWGAFDAPHGQVDGPIGRDPRHRTRMAVVAGGRPAWTTYRVVRAHDRPVVVTEVDCELGTGRTHQIRVHLQAIGHPVVGDARYGGARPSFPLDRQFLHASHLRFTHPTTATPMSFTSDLPPDLADALTRLG